MTNGAPTVKYEGDTGVQRDAERASRQRPPRGFRVPNPKPALTKLDEDEYYLKEDDFQPGERLPWRVPPLNRRLLAREVVLWAVVGVLLTGILYSLARFT